MPKDSINIHIGAKDAASAVFQGVSARAVAFGVTLWNLATKALAGIMNGLRGWVNEALEAEVANVKLDAALRGSGQYTAQLAQQYRDLANAVQDETGASDESVKSHIAQLVTLGVLPDKMAVATRSVAALAAMGRDGNQAMVAVARALNGDIAGFERFSPEVRNATTITEKFAAANNLLAAGYAQQQANLQTVGGAWKALQGRLGDAREDIIGAVFDGLKLGKTFDSMQASVGRFLKSDAFTGFTEALRKGVGYALDIGKAMTAKGGTAEVATAFGNVILGALKDGAEYIGVKILNAFENTKSIFGEARVKLATMAGTDEAEARKTVYGGKTEYKGGAFAGAVKELTAVVKANVATVEAQGEAMDDGMEEYLAYLEHQRIIDDRTLALKQAALVAQNRITTAENNKATAAENTLYWENMATGYAKAEANAKATALRNQNRQNQLAGQNTSEYIASVQSGREEKKERDKTEAKTQKKIYGLMRRIGMVKPDGNPEGMDKLEERLGGAEKKGTHLSANSVRMLRDVRDQASLRKAANDQMIQGRKDELNNRKLKDAAEATLTKQRAQNAKNLQKIADKIESTLEAGN